MRHRAALLRSRPRVLPASPRRRTHRRRGSGLATGWRGPRRGATRDRWKAPAIASCSLRRTGVRWKRASRSRRPRSSSDAAFPPLAGALSAEARAVLADPLPDDPALDSLLPAAPRGRDDDARSRRARDRLHGSPHPLRAAGRIVRDRFGDAPRRGEVPASGGRSSRPSCSCGRAFPRGRSRAFSSPGERAGAHARIPQRLQRRSRRRSPSLDRGLRPGTRLGAVGSGRAREHGHGAAPRAGPAASRGLPRGRRRPARPS